MIKIENIQVFNLEGAIKGMRFPMQSGEKSDSKHEFFGYLQQNGQLYSSEETKFVVGPNDLTLARKLINAGSDHSKFMRQILVSMDITSSLYWWKEMDQYRIGVTTNSESTMHRLAKTPITKECFSLDSNLTDLPVMQSVSWEFPQIQPLDNFIYDCIFVCENLRQKYVETGDKRYWRALIQLLPSSWNQKRHWTGNYATLLNICSSREGHKLSEWKEFIDSIRQSCPYFPELLEAYNER